MTFKEGRLYVCTRTERQPTWDSDRPGSPSCMSAVIGAGPVTCVIGGKDTATFDVIVKKYPEYAKTRWIWSEGDFEEYKGEVNLTDYIKTELEL